MVCGCALAGTAACLTCCNRAIHVAPYTLFEMVETPTKIRVNQSPPESIEDIVRRVIREEK